MLYSHRLKERKGSRERSGDDARIAAAAQREHVPRDAIRVRVCARRRSAARTRARAPRTTRRARTGPRAASDARLRCTPPILQCRLRAPVYSCKSSQKLYFLIAYALLFLQVEWPTQLSFKIK